MSSTKVKAGEAYIEIGIRNRIAQGVKGIQSDLNKISRNVVASGSTIAKLGGVVAAASGGLLAYPIKAASDMQEAMGKFGVVFGDSAKTVEAWSDATAQAMGVSEVSMASMLSGMQDLLVPMGVMPSAATDMSKTLSTLAVDLGSFNNMEVDSVFTDMLAAMTGSGEVMKKYGVILTEAGVKQELLNMGMDPKAVDDAAKAQARLNIIMRGTSAAQGDAIRTSGSFANVVKSLRSLFVDLSATVGGTLIEDFATFLSIFRGGAVRVKEFANQNKDLVRVIGLGVVAVSGIAGAAVALGSAFVVGGIAIGGLASVVALLASPMGIAAAAAAALGYAIVKYTNVAGYAIDWLTTRFGPLVETVQNSIGAITAAIAAGDMTTAWELSTDLMELVWLDLTGGMQDAWGEAMGYLLDSGSATAQGIAEIFKALSAAFGGMLDAYKSTYDSIYNFTADNLNAAGASLTGIETIGAPAPKGSAFEQQFSGTESTLRGTIDSIRQFGQNMSDEAQGQISGRMAERSAATAEREAKIAALRMSLNQAGTTAAAAKAAKAAQDADPKSEQTEIPDFVAMLEEVKKKTSSIDNAIESEKAVGPTGTFSANAAGIIGMGAKGKDPQLAAIDKNGREANKLLRKERMARFAR